MTSFTLNIGPPVTYQHPDWKRLDDGSWQCGTIQIRLVSFDMIGDYRLEQWGLWILTADQWVQCYCKSRPWLYGSPGQAKRGVPKAGEMTIGNPLEQENRDAE